MVQFYEKAAKVVKMDSPLTGLPERLELAAEMPQYAVMSRQCRPRKGSVPS